MRQLRITYPIPKGKSTSGFAWRGGVFHMGEDIVPTTSNNRVLAVADGVVVFVSQGCVEGDTNCGGGYGNYITIDHQNGYFTRYAHLSAVQASKGQKVHKGRAIGIVGNTGLSSGVHLHFEIMTANTFYAQNPSAFLDPKPFLEGTSLFPAKKGGFTLLQRFVQVLLYLFIASGLLAFFVWAMRGFPKSSKGVPPPPDAGKELGSMLAAPPPPVAAKSASATK